LEVLNISSTTNTLRIEGNAGDAIQGDGWIYNRNIVDSGTTYHRYTHGEAILEVNADIDQSAITGIFDIDHQDLYGTSGFTLEAPGGFQLGSSVASAGDLNGDGFEDLIVGATKADEDGVSGVGKAYVLFGHGNTWDGRIDIDTYLDGNNGFEVSGLVLGDYLGESVSSGDINGDGLSDLVLGARYSDSGGAANAGEVYVIYGKTDGWNTEFDLDTLDGSNGFRLTGTTADDQYGYKVYVAGDINGDGFDDILTSGTGSNQYDLIFGDNRGWDASASLDALTDGTRGVAIPGLGTDDEFGFREIKHKLGDINGDGYDDLLLSANMYDGTAGTDSGIAYVVFGQASGWDASLDLSTLNGSNGFIIEGVSGDDRLGHGGVGAGDINGDGIEDIFIGSIYENNNGYNNNGAAYVIFGQTSGWGSSFDLTSLDGSNGMKFEGLAEDWAYLGMLMSGAGDVNGDGFDDLA
ncbi:hypothetical protein ACQZV8_21090, partial [Magnetococcales bacterium HHB-1]